VVAAVNAFKDATNKSIEAANAVKTATQAKNFSAIKDAKKKVEAAAEAVKKAKTDVTKAIDALKAAGPEAEAAVKAMGIDLAAFSVNLGSATASAKRLKSVDTVNLIYSMHSGVTNPALINEEKYMTARFLFGRTLETFYNHEAGFTMPIGLYGAAGVSWIMNSASPFPATDGSGMEIEGQYVDDQKHFVALTYANNVWKGLTVGGNLNIIAQNITEPEVDGKSVKNAMRLGFGADIGLTYKILRHQMLGNHILGVSTNNLVNMIRDTDEKYVAALRFSLFSDFWKKRIFFGADFVLKDFLADGAKDFTPDAVKGMPWENTYKIGASFLRVFNLYALFGLNNEGLDHYGFAFGANMPIPGFPAIRSVEGVMQFVSIVNPSYGAEEANASRITFYARTEFGKPRE